MRYMRLCVLPLRAEREAAGDPRPSLEERYPTPQCHVDAVEHAAAELLRERLLLPADAAEMVERARARGIGELP